MTDRDGFRIVDRRTFRTDDGEPAEPETEPLAEPATGQSDKPTYVQQLEERTRRAEEQLARYIEAYKVEVGENLAKTQARLEREAARELSRMKGELVSELLEVLDNFDRSLEALPASADDSLRHGLRLVREQFFGTLARFGLALVEAEGARFDPREHEAVSTTPVSDPGRDGVVAAVLKPGYRLGEQLLRPALVQVGRLPQ